MEVRLNSDVFLEFRLLRQQITEQMLAKQKKFALMHGLLFRFLSTTTWEKSYAIKIIGKKEEDADFEEWLSKGTVYQFKFQPIHRRQLLTIYFSFEGSNRHPSRKK